MNVKMFVKRPILSASISVLIVLVGVIGLVNLPMEQYPDIAPPTITVSSTYTGANAETVLNSVVTPLEDAINGVEDMTYMTSQSTNTGSASITVYFKQGTDPDMATINVKNRVSQAEGNLPAEVTKVGVTVQKRQSGFLKILTLYSPDNRYDQNFITNYFNINIEPKLLRVNGVGEVMTMGEEYAMRIWLNPQKLAAYNLEPSDVVTALDAQNVEAATGTLGEDSENVFQYTLKYRGRFRSAEEFDNIVIKAGNGGEVLRLKDVARVELGSQRYAYANRVNSHNGTTAMVTQTAGSNARMINLEIDELCKEIEKDLPEGLELGNLMDTNEFLDASDASFRNLVFKYKNGLKLFFRRKWMAWSMLGLAAILLVVLMKTTKTGLIPDEDTGTIFVNVTTPAGSTLAQTQKTMKEIEDSIKSIDEIESYSNVAGYSMLGGQSAAGGFIIVKLKNWDERPGDDHDINAVIRKITEKTANIKSGSIFAFAQPTIMGYGTSNGFELYVQDRKGGEVKDLMTYTNNFIAALNKRPEIMMAYTTFDTNFPQYKVEVDAAKCQRAGITPTSVLDVLNGYIGGNYASNFNEFSKLYRVIIQADKQYRHDREALDNMFVRTASGDMAPVGQFITLEKVYDAELLTRFNLYTSVAVNGLPADGYSTGDCIKAIEEVAAETLPTGYGYEYSGMTREEAGSNSNTVIIFVICLIFVYVILCALYESLFIPLAVMLSVPFGLFGSFLFAKVFGLENNIYMQVGLIMLIGLLAKTAILLTEYASERRRESMTIASAAMSAAGARLRPIIMTALAMLIGMLPLALSSGAVANGNVSLSMGVIGGLSVGIATLLFVVPVFFIAFQTIQEKIMPNRNFNETEEEQE